MVQMHRQLNEILAFMGKLVHISLLLKQKSLVWVEILPLLNAPTHLVLLCLYSSLALSSPHTYIPPHFLRLLHIIPSNHLLPQRNPHSAITLASFPYLTLSNAPCFSSGHTNRCSDCSELISSHTLNSFVSSRINS